VALWAEWSQRVRKARRGYWGSTPAGAVSWSRNPQCASGPQRGLLERIEGRKPVEIFQCSVIDLERILQGVRDTFPTHQWTKALAAFLHRDLLG
jgi:hypothetical protein